MELIYLILMVFATGAFGYFLAQSIGGGGKHITFAFIAVCASAVLSALSEADATTTSWQLAFNLLVYNAFALGFVLGRPRQQWFKRYLLVSMGLIGTMFITLL